MSEYSSSGRTGAVPYALGAVRSGRIAPPELWMRNFGFAARRERAAVAWSALAVSGGVVVR